TINEAPTVDAGANEISCMDVAAVPLAGTFTIAGGVKWTTAGNGSLSDDTDENSNYLPSNEDKAKVSVVLTLTTTGNGLCKANKDVMRIDFTPAPTVNAWFPQTICENTGAVSLNGSHTVSSGISWSTSAGTAALADAASLSTTYTP